MDGWMDGQMDAWVDGQMMCFYETIALQVNYLPSCFFLEIASASSLLDFPSFCCLPFFPPPLTSPYSPCLTLYSISSCCLIYYSHPSLTLPLFPLTPEISPSPPGRFRPPPTVLPLLERETEQ